MNFIKRGISFTFEILQTVVLAASIFVVIYLFAAQPHQVKGASMETNFYDGEYILTEKISYKLRSPKRGEVVIFSAPNKTDVDYIKRVIALPFERIKIEKGIIYINGKPLKEDYEPSKIKNSSGRFLREGQEFIVPENLFFVLGDNRSHSSDSREFGPIKKETIVGKAVFRYWPIKRLGKIKNPNYSFLY